MTRILIIDDETRIRNLYKNLLEDEGYEVIVAKDSTDATYTMIKEQEFDLILLDINMPEIDGSHMREIIDIYEPGFPVIVSSVRPIDEQKKMIPKANDYFDKAQGTEILLEKINKALQNV